MSNYQMTLFLPKYHYMLQEERRVQLKPGNAIISDGDNVDQTAEGTEDFKLHQIYFKNIPALRDDSAFGLDEFGEATKQGMGVKYELRKDQKGPMDNELVTSSSLFAGHTRWRVKEPVIIRSNNGKKVEKMLYWNNSVMEDDIEAQEPVEEDVDEDKKVDEPERTLLAPDEVHAWLHKRKCWQDITFANEPLISYKSAGAGCAPPAGEEDAEEFSLPNSAFSASSMQSGCEAHQGRLDGDSYWQPADTDGKPFLEVDMGKMQYVESIKLQGTSWSYIKKFRLQHSMNGCTWHMVDRVFEIPAEPEDMSATETYFVHPIVRCQFFRMYPLEWEGGCTVKMEIMADTDGIVKPIFITPARFMHPTADLLEVVSAAKADMSTCDVICFDLPAMLKNGLDHMVDMHYWSMVENDDPDELDMVTISVPGRLNQEVYELLADLHIGDFVGNFNLQEVAHRSEPVHKQPPHNDVELHRCQAVTELVVESVLAGGRIDFDYIVYLIVAAIIAMMGLGSDSVVSVIASMLVSPIMGPVMCIAFGVTLKRWDMFYLGLLNEMISLGVCLLVGFLGGLLFTGLDRDSFYQWPTAQMSGRGTYRGLMEGCFVAAASGLGVSVGLMQGGINALVGVAISASLLPPVVNTGMLLAWQITGKDLSDEDRTKHAIQAMNSLLLTLLNIFLVIAAAVIMFKVKEVLPHTHDSAAYWKAMGGDDDAEDDKEVAEGNIHKNKGDSAKAVGTGGRTKLNPPKDGGAGHKKPWAA